METLPRNVLWPNFAKRDGLLPVVVQCVQTHMVLMQAWVNEEAYAATLRTGKAHYFSTSRERLWMKGEESGAVQNVQDVLLDCDARRANRGRRLSYASSHLFFSFGSTRDS